MTQRSNYKTLNSFKKDVEVCYRAAIREYKTQNVTMHIQFYPNIKPTDSIKQRQKEINIRIESLRLRLKRDAQLDNNFTNEDHSDSFLKIEDKINKSLAKLREDEQLLIERIEQLHDIESQINDHNLKVMNDCHNLDSSGIVIKTFFEKNAESIKLLLDKSNRYITLPVISTITDITQLDGKTVEANKMLRFLSCVLFQHRYGDSKNQQNLNILIDDLFSLFSESYRNAIGSAVFHGIRKSGEKLHSNYKVMSMLCNIT
jgi:hypothetical protein